MMYGLFAKIAAMQGRNPVKNPGEIQRNSETRSFFKLLTTPDLRPKSSKISHWLRAPCALFD